MDETKLVAAAFLVLLNKNNKSRADGRKRKMWVRPFLYQRSENLARELMLDSYLFQNFTRMSKQDFEYLCSYIGPKITKSDTNMRKAITVTTRLAITLRFLATGDSYRSLMYLFKVHFSSICLIIPEVCVALVEGLKEYVKMPSCQNEWRKISMDFFNRWNFPNCVGSMDGKHVAIICPPHSGSKYFNYKQFFSIVLFAVVDANYQFIYVHVGCQGRISDGGVFRHTPFGKSLLEGGLGLPDPEPLIGREKRVPFVFLADDAFPLTENICKPYSTGLHLGSPKRICNYRISRARRVVENAFGLLASVFRILHKTIDLKLENTQNVIMACVHLHNFLRRNPQGQSLYSPPGIFDTEDIDTGKIMNGSWRNNEIHLTGLQNIPRNTTSKAKEVRDEYMNYFTSEEGRVAWQDMYCEANPLT